MSGTVNLNDSSNTSGNNSNISSSSSNNNNTNTSNNNNNNSANNTNNSSRDVKVRLHVSNIPYDLRWQDLKDLFKEKVGSDVCYVEIYEGSDGKSTGAGVIEVKGRELADRAIELLHRSELKGRQLVVREEKEKDRQAYGKLQNPSSTLGMDSSCLGNGMNMNNSLAASAMLPAGMHLLCHLGVDVENITNQIFIANLDYNVTVKKLKEVFVMAGSISHAELKLDKDGTSRGMATIRYESAIEAMQAIGMFNGHFLYERQMNVRMDKMAESTPQFVPAILPAGLKSVGFALGPGGQPLVNVGQITNAMIVNNLLSLNYGKLFSESCHVFSGDDGLFNNMANSMSPNGSGGGNILGNNSNNNAGNNRALGSRNFNPFLQNPGAFFGGLNNPNSLNLLNELRAYSWPSLPLGLGFGSRVPGVFNPNMNFHPNHFPQNNFLTNGLGSGAIANGVNNGGINHHNLPFGTRQGPQESTTVIVKNLPPGTTWQSLKDRFKEAGEIQYADTKTENGKFKGVGTVRFSNIDGSRKAIALFNGSKIDGRQIEVKFDV